MKVSVDCSSEVSEEDKALVEKVLSEQTMGKTGEEKVLLVKDNVLNKNKEFGNAILNYNIRKNLYDIYTSMSSGVKTMKEYNKLSKQLLGILHADRTRQGKGTADTVNFNVSSLESNIDLEVTNINVHAEAVYMKLYAIDKLKGVKNTLARDNLAKAEFEIHKHIETYANKLRKDKLSINDYNNKIDIKLQEVINNHKSSHPNNIPKDMLELAGDIYKLRLRQQNTLQAYGIKVNVLDRYIKPNPSWSIAKLNKKSKELFAHKMIELLDLDYMTKRFKLGSIGIRRALERTHTKIVTDGGMSSDEISFAAIEKDVKNYLSSDIAVRMGMSRFMHLKDAESWNEANKLFGKDKTLWEFYKTSIEATAKNTAIMRTLGTKPDDTIKFIENLDLRIRKDIETKSYIKENPVEAKKLKELENKFIKYELYEKDITELNATLSPLYNKLLPYSEEGDGVRGISAFELRKELKEAIEGVKLLDKYIVKVSPLADKKTLPKGRRVTFKETIKYKDKPKDKLKEKSKDTSKEEPKDKPITVEGDIKINTYIVKSNKIPKDLFSKNDMDKLVELRNSYDNLLTHLTNHPHSKETKLPETIGVSGYDERPISSRETERTIVMGSLDTEFTDWWEGARATLLDTQTTIADIGKILSDNRKARAKAFKKAEEAKTLEELNLNKHNTFKKYLNNFYIDIAGVKGDYFSNKILYEGNNTFKKLWDAKSHQGIRNWMTLTKLGGVVQSSIIGDLSKTFAVTMFSQMRFSTIVKNLFVGLDKEELRKAGILFININGDVNRYDPHSTGYGKSSRLVQTMFKYTGVTHSTNAMQRSTRAEASRAIMKELKGNYNEVSKEFKGHFETYGISEEVFNTMKAVQKNSKDNSLINLELFDIRIENERNAVALYRQMVEGIGTSMVVMPDSFSRTLGGRLDGTSEIQKYLMQFKSFPVTMLTKIIRSHVKEFMYGNKADAITMGLRDAVFLTASGLAIMEIKAYTTGAKSPWFDDDTTGWDYWVQGGLQGGVGGILADVLLNDGKKYNKDLLDVIAGPALGDASKGLGLIQGTFDGIDEKDAVRSIKFIKSLIPFQNVPYVKPFLNSLLNGVVESFSPETKKYRKKRDRDLGRHGYVQDIENAFTD